MSRLGWLSLSAPYEHWRMLAGVHGLAGSTPALSSILVAGATQACGECLGNCLSPQAQRREEMSDTHNVINCEHGVPIRAWTRDVAITAAKAIEVPGTTSRLEMQKCGRP